MPVTASVDPTTYEDPSTSIPLIPIESEVGHCVGYSVAYSGDGTIAVVGAPFYENQNNVSTGCAFVFTYVVDTWVKTLQLLPTTNFTLGQFGRTVAISSDGSTIAIGARNERDANGAVYVYTKVEGVWTLQTKLLAPFSAHRSYFGRALALSATGDVLAVGVSKKKKTSGNVFVYKRTANVWGTPVRVLDNTVVFPKFGRALALSAAGTELAVSDTGRDNNTGAVLIYVLRESAWLFAAAVTPEDAEPGERFGSSVALSAEGTVLVGGSYAKSGGIGGATVFRGGGETWVEEAFLLGSDSVAGDRFGRSVAITDDGEVIFVGTAFDDTVRGINSGSMYVFTTTAVPGEWDEAALVVVGDGTVNDQFGHSVAVSADGASAAVGAFADANERGALYIVNWTPVART